MQDIQQRAAKMAELMTALVEGKTIQYVSAIGHWVDANYNEGSPTSYLPNIESRLDKWRVKPEVKEPRKLWAFYRHDILQSVWQTQEQAEKAVDLNKKFYSYDDQTKFEVVPFTEDTPTN